MRYPFLALISLLLPFSILAQGDCVTSSNAESFNNYSTAKRQTNDDTDRNMEMCLQCANLAVHLCHCERGTYPGTPEQLDHVIRENIKIIRVWANEHGKNYPLNCKALCDGYTGGCKSKAGEGRTGTGSSSGNSSSAGSSKDRGTEINEMTMTEFDGTSEGSLKTLAKGVGAAAATGQINAGLVAGAAGLLLSGPSPAEKARRAQAEAAERERQERIRREREEAERRARLRNEYMNSIKKYDCVNVVTGSGVDEVYTYYIVKTANGVIITDVFNIPRQDDGDWPYCTDIEKKLKTQLSKSNPKDAATYQYYIQKPYKERSDAAYSNEAEHQKAQSHYSISNGDNYRFEPEFGKVLRNVKADDGKKLKDNFWDN
jgi:hypothetical protein